MKKVTIQSIMQIPFNNRWLTPILQGFYLIRVVWLRDWLRDSDWETKQLSFAVAKYVAKLYKGVLKVWGKHDSHTAEEFFSVTLGNEKIVQVSSFTYLGCIISKDGMKSFSALFKWPKNWRAPRPPPTLIIFPKSKDQNSEIAIFIQCSRKTL